MGVNFDFNYAHFRNRINGIGAVESSMMETFNRRVFTAIQKTAEGARERKRISGEEISREKNHLPVLANEDENCKTDRNTWLGKGLLWENVFIHQCFTCEDTCRKYRDGGKCGSVFFLLVFSSRSKFTFVNSITYFHASSIKQTKLLKSKKS